MDQSNFEDTRFLLPRFRSDHASGVGTWLRGVFEGGGAKGVAYRGALEAVEAEGCWFEAVAGSSAGAITAALIAAGYSPREFDEPMIRLLEMLELPKLRTGVKNLREKGEIFSSRDFREALDELLGAKMSSLGIELGAEPLTFRQLFEATGIALFVVAADVSRQEPVVFHHRYTPDCQVAAAVVASASIPFAFDAGMLTSDATVLRPDPPLDALDDLRVFRTIVDGGVWTNFPMFIFQDEYFIRYMDLATGNVEEMGGRPAGPVVGFLLHELADDEGGKADAAKRLQESAAAYRGARFELETPTRSWLMPLEQADRPTMTSVIQDARKSKRMSRRCGPSALRWPNPDGEFNRGLFAMADKVLAWASDSLGAGILLAGVSFVQLLLLGLLIWYFGHQIAKGWNGGAWDQYGPILAAGAIGTYYLAQLLSMIVLFGSAVVGNWALRLPARRVLYGVATTLVATPGTSPWEHLRDEVIALEIPSSISTLKVPSDTEREDVIRRARAVTAERLPLIVEASKGS